MLAFHQLIRNESSGPSNTAPPNTDNPPIQLTADLFAAEQEEVSEVFQLDLTEPEKMLLGFLGFDVVSVDLAVERSELSAEEVSILLMSLELKGVVQSVPGGFQKVRESITA